jgi:hypothetical protein
MNFDLPAEIRALVAARNNLRQRYVAVGLTFTIDGNLVGDLGEAIAAELFGIQLSARNGTGIDGRAPDGRSVQVKATGSSIGPAFRQVDTRADHLLFFALDFERCTGEVVYNGPEHPVIACLPEIWTGQRMVSLTRIRSCNALVDNSDRLPMLIDQRDAAKHP